MGVLLWFYVNLTLSYTLCSFRVYNMAYAHLKEKQNATCVLLLDVE